MEKQSIRPKFWAFSILWILTLTSNRSVANVVATQGVKVVAQEIQAFNARLANLNETLGNGGVFPAQVAAELDAVNLAAKKAVVEIEKAGVTDPEATAFVSTAKKLRSVQAIWLSLYNGGCLQSNDPDLLDISRGVLLGAAGSQPCKLATHSLTKVYDKIEDFQEEGLGAQKVMGAKDSGHREIQNLLEFYKSSLRSAMKRIIATERVLRYTLTGELPNCKTLPSKEELVDCTNFVAQTKVTEAEVENGTVLLKPTTPKILAVEANAAIQKAVSTYNESMAAIIKNRGETKDMVPTDQVESAVVVDGSDVDVHKSIPEFGSLRRAVFSVQGFGYLKATPAINAKVGDFLTADISVAPRSVKAGVITPEDVELGMSQALKALKTAKKQIVERGKELNKFSKRVDEDAIPEDSTWLSDKISQAMVAVGMDGDSTKIKGVLNRSKADDLIGSWLVERPMDFGAALVENPEFILDACESIKRLMASNDYNEIGKEAANSLGIVSALQATASVDVGARLKDASGIGLMNAYSTIQSALGTIRDKNADLAMAQAAMDYNLANSVERVATSADVSLNDFRKREEALAQELAATTANAVFTETSSYVMALGGAVGSVRSVRAITKSRLARRVGAKGMEMVATLKVEAVWEKIKAAFAASDSFKQKFMGLFKGLSPEKSREVMTKIVQGIDSASAKVNDANDKVGKVTVGVGIIEAILPVVQGLFASEKEAIRYFNPNQFTQ